MPFFYILLKGGYVLIFQKSVNQWNEGLHSFVSIYLSLKSDAMEVSIVLCSTSS